MGLNSVTSRSDNEFNGPCSKIPEGFEGLWK